MLSTGFAGQTKCGCCHSGRATLPPLSKPLWGHRLQGGLFGSLLGSAGPFDQPAARAACPQQRGSWLSAGLGRSCGQVGRPLPQQAPVPGVRAPAGGDGPTLSPGPAWRSLPWADVLALAPWPVPGGRARRGPGSDMLGQRLPGHWELAAFQLGLPASLTARRLPALPAPPPSWTVTGLYLLLLQSARPG